MGRKPTWVIFYPVKVVYVDDVQGQGYVVTNRCESVRIPLAIQAVHFRYFSFINPQRTICSRSIMHTDKNIVV